MIFIYKRVFSKRTTTRTTMTRFHIQMKKMRNDPKNYDNIWPNGDWTLQDYKDMCWCIERGYLVQDLSCCSMFMINQEWEGEDIYADEFICSEEANSLYVGNCMKCSKKNDGDWDNNCEDPICIECGEIWKYNENDDSYYKIIKEEEEEQEELKSYNGVMMPKYVNGREVISYPNAGLKKDEEEVECHDCGEISKCYDKKQGVSMGGEIYDYDIGDCCKDKYENE